MGVCIFHRPREWHSVGGIAYAMLPMLLGIDGIWLAIGAAELLAVAVTAAFLVVNRKKYHYA